MTGERINLLELPPEDLRRLWMTAKDERGNQVSQRDFAKRHGFSAEKEYQIIHSRISNATQRSERRTPPPEHPDETSERVTDEQHQNERVVDCRSQRITTLEELIAFCKIDLNEWIIERHVINKWEIGRKDIHKQITWEEGVANGSVSDSGGINVEPLIQVKVWLVKRHPDRICIPVQPVTLRSSIPGKPRPKTGLRCALIVPDMQVGYRRDLMTGRLDPFHDRRAIDVVLQIAQDQPFDDVLFLGDLHDMTEWTDKFVRFPEFTFTTQPALVEAHWILSQFRRARPQARHAYIPGNHENRLAEHMVNHLKMAYGLRPADQIETEAMSLDNLLGLSRLGIEVTANYPAGEAWLNDTTRCVHGEVVRGQNGATAKAVVDRANETVIFGHIHRREMACKTIRTRYGRRSVTTFSPGCLCRIDGAVPGSRQDDQWQQGAGVVWYDDERSSIVPIEIEDGRAIYNGRLYQGRDRLDDLRKDAGSNWGY